DHRSLVRLDVEDALVAEAFEPHRTVGRAVVVPELDVERRARIVRRPSPSAEDAKARPEVEETPRLRDEVAGDGDVPSQIDEWRVPRPCLSPARDEVLEEEEAHG